MAVVKDWQPQVILMDYMMPVMDGLESTRRIRALKAGRKAALICVSADVLGDLQERMETAGADAFVAKPFREEELCAAIEATSGVRLSYEDVATLDEELEQVPLEALHLDGLSPDLLKRMKAALEQGAMQDFTACLDEVREVDEQLAEALRRFVADYRYDDLHELLA